MKKKFKPSITLGLLLALVALAGCSLQPTAPETPKDEAGLVALSWESTTEPHPERKPWSDSLIKRLEADWAIFDGAKDIGTFCPKYSTLGKPARLKAWGELWVGLAYFESGYNAKSSSVDVGTKGDRGSWSVGLWQVSANDQSWAGGNTKYTVDELLTPEPNIHLATVLMRRQLKNTGLIVLPNSSKYRYWATLLSGNKYDKTAAIIARVKKNVPSCE